MPSTWQFNPGLNSKCILLAPASPRPPPPTHPPAPTAETKAVPIEEVQLIFARHRVWGKVMGRDGQEMLAESDKRDAALLHTSAEAGTHQ